MNIKLNNADTGKVNTQASSIALTVSVLFDIRVCVAPAPITAADFAWVVLAGKPKTDSKSNATEETRSEANPAAGFAGASSPKRLIIFLPPKSVPNDISTALTNAVHTGTVICSELAERHIAAARASTPANFCPSCAPWAMEDRAAPNTCSFLKESVLMLACRSKNFAAKKAIIATGRVERAMPSRVFSHSPALIAEMPATAAAAPLSPAVNA